MNNWYLFDLGIHHLILIDKTILQKYVSNKLVLVLFPTAMNGPLFELISLLVWFMLTA